MENAIGDDNSTGPRSEMDAETGRGEGEAFPGSATSDAAPDPPYEGMEFETEEDAWTFYNTYARRIGFNTRISVFHRSRRDGSVTSRQFVCAREGFRAPRPRKDTGDREKARRMRAVTRVGCKAMIRVKKQDNGRWAVSKLHKVHNHELEAPSRAHCLRSHRLLSESGRNAPVSIQGAKEESSVINESYTVITHQSMVAGGVQSILEYLQHMQVEDSGFFYAMQSNGDRCTGNAFWADARSRMDYKHFGDAITFDTSYRTDQYLIPFASFTGVNHHRQPVLFGCALLVDDSESSLIWLFQTFLSAMSGCHPTTITTEQDGIIHAAVTQVFLQTRHRLCKWHILKEGQDKLSDVCHAYPSFQGEFNKCINMTETIEEFESCWEMLITRFDLRHNEWLQSVYSCRHQWVPVYLRNTFFAEMSPTQQCESRSLFFEGYVNVQTDAEMFIQQYEKALDTRFEKEVKADFDTIYALPVLKTPSPMEKQAAELYTWKIFTKFQEELIETSVYTANKVSEEGEISTYKVAKLDEEHKAYTVMFSDSEIRATCSCQMFEYSGILCRHILTVFRVTSVLTLPSHFILKRWTKNVRNERVSEISNRFVTAEVDARSQSNSQDTRQSLTWRYNSLCHEAIKFAEDGATSISIYNVAMHALQEAVKKVAKAKETGEDGGLPNVISQEEIGNKGIQSSMEKDLQDIQVLGSGDGRSLSLQEVRHAHEVLLSQQPLKFVLVAPGLSGESRSPDLLTASAPLALNKPNGGLDRNGPVVVSVPTASIPKGDPKNGGTASQTSQGWNLVGIGQADNDPSNGSEGPSSGSSEPQLVAVPVAFYVPMINSIPAACAAATNSSTQSSPMNSSTPLGFCSSSQVLHQPQPVSHLVAAKSPSGTPTRTHESRATNKKKNPPSKMSTASMNPIRAAAIAAGARIAPPSAAASIIKAMHSRNAIHIRAGGYSAANLPSPSSLNPFTPKPLGLGPASFLNVPVDLGVVANVSTACNQPVTAASSGPTATCKAEKSDGPTDASDESGENQSPAKGMDFIDSGDDEDLTDSNASGG